ncbi:MAG: hypothetical protein HC867_04725 [Bacteroidia bacterium]|nr:hypothetical protein [Bacteroidia bacterium]
MFTHVWKKYMPVIAILLKRSVNGPQTLDMNYTDFERAAGGKKVKFSFSSLKLENGRILNGTRHTPLAKDLVLALQESELTQKMIRKQQIEFSMVNGCQLVIQNNTPPHEPEQEQEQEEAQEPGEENSEEKGDSDPAAPAAE